MQLVTLLLLACLAAGCTVLGRDVGSPLDKDALASLAGGGDVGDVLDQLGPPAKISALPGGFVFVYDHLDIVETQLGFSFDGEIIELLKVSMGSASAKREMSMIAFDDQGKIKNLGFDKNDLAAGRGGNVQFIVAVNSVVDTSGLESDLKPNEWGMWCLQELAETLNRSSSLETGEAGVSQLGEVLKAGQYSLEMR